MDGLTELGKVLKKIRIREGILLYDMAIAIGVSSSYLSGVEHGKKKPSIEWLDIICNKYSISEQEKECLNRLMLEQINVEIKDTTVIEHRTLVFNKSDFKNFIDGNKGYYSNVKLRNMN